jgi:hypothetical protein
MTACGAVPCHTLSESDCVADDRCTPATASDPCTQSAAVYGGCLDAERLRQEPCSDTGGFGVVEGECLFYSAGGACVPEQAESCAPSCP